MKTHAVIKSICVAAGLSLLLESPAYSVRRDADDRPGRPAPQAGPKAGKVRARSADQNEAAGLAESAGVKTEWHSRLGTPLSIRGPGLGQRRAYSGGKGLAVQGGGRYEADAIAVMDNLSRFCRIKDAEKEFSVKRVEKDALGFHHVRLAQSHQGLRVFGGEMLVHFDQTGDAYQVNGRYVPDIEVDVTPKIGADEAAQAAQRDLAAMGRPAGTLEAKPALVIFAQDTDPLLAYELTLLTQDPQAGPGQWRYWIDTGSGKVLLRYDDVKKIAPPTANGAHATVTGNILAGEGGQLLGITGWRENTGYYYLYNTNRHWLVYNLATSGYPDNNTYAYRTTSDWGTSDRSEVSAARNFDLVQGFYTTVFGRHSFDDAGLIALANVHEGNSYVNAFWDGSDFHFGDGDGIEANSLAVLDICGHEYTHAVTDYSSGLIYSYESGALNESFSDILGGCVEFFTEPDGRAYYPNKSPGTADWLCGEDCWLSSVALRDMRNPRNTATVGAGNEQPSRYHGSYWYSGTGDNGGVHQNSGVQNFFFYLLSEGGSGNNDGILYTVAGIGITNAGQVAFRALTVYCTPSTDYELARSAWISAAMDLNTNWTANVGAAWSAVGIGALIVTPENVAFRGPVGGPFTPPSQACTLLNRSGVPMSWSATSSQAWLALSAASGTIPANGSNVLTLSVAAAAGALPMGIYTNNLVLSNSLETTLVTRQVRLLVGQPDYFTELFDANDNDLGFQTLTFTPNGSADFYALCRETATAFPTDPGGGTIVSLGDDSYVQVTLAGTSTVSIYGRRTNVFFISSNGYLTMNAGDSTFEETLANHFSLPRVSACFDDLYPGSGGTVTWKQTGDRAAVTFLNVREYGTAATVSFQIEMFYDGRIRITYLGVSIGDGLAGLSAGTGVPAGFVESDLSSYSTCPPPDNLVVTPLMGLGSQGYQGGPFTPSSATYTLTNAGASMVNWSATVTQPWVTAGATAGSLAPGASATVAVAINSGAGSLGVGDYSALVTFSNLASGFAHTRAVVLHVAPIPGQLVVLDSFPPATDRRMPFGEVMVGSSRSGQIIVTNADPTYSLILSNISLRGSMYIEDFEDGLAQGWVPDSAANWQVVAGEYRAQSSVTVFMVSRYGDQQWADLTAQMSCRRTGSPYSASAVVLRATADFADGVGSGYVFQISTGGSYGVWKQVDGTWSWLQSWTSSTAVNAGTNVLAAVAEGSALRFYINGTLVWSGADTALTGGRIGLMGYNDATDPTTHYFDNVIVGGPQGGGAISARQQWLNERAVAAGDRAVAPTAVLPDYADPPAAPQPEIVGLTFLSTTNGNWRLENLPGFPFSLPAGGALTLNVTFAPTRDGSNDAKVVITSNDADEPAVEVQMTAIAIPDHLRVTPSTGFVSQGAPGGPFSPSSTSYVLSNAGPSSINWTAGTSQNWVSVAPAGGTLPVGQTAGVTVALTALANSLPGGQYSASVAFSNLNSAAIQRRAVALTVQIPPPTLAEALDTPGWTWLTGGTMPWIGQTTNTHDGVDAAQSGQISHSQETWMETTVGGPGTLTFWWRVSSESGYDYLQFLVNGALIQQMSGIGSWTWVSNRIASGTQTLRWRYMKDSSVNTGEDKGWVDQVSFVADSPCPRIVSQPVSVAVGPGGTAVFTVGVEGASPMYYQWRKNASPLDRATNAILTLANVQTNDVGTYSVLVSNFCGSVLSSNATLTLLPAGLDLITFDDLPGSGSSVPSGYHSLTWNNFSYLNVFQTTNASGYYAGVISLSNVAYNPYGTSAEISRASPFNLASAYLTAAWNDNLQVQALGYAGSTLLYNNTYILSATAPSLINFNYSGVTRVVFNSSGGTPHPGYPGSGTHFAVDNMTLLTATNIPPVVTLQPAPVTVMAGESATFCVGAAGSLPLSYSWRRNGNPIAGATQSCYTTNNVRLSDSGDTFSCLVSNAFGSVLSSNAVLTVQVPPPPPAPCCPLPANGAALVSILHPPLSWNNATGYLTARFEADDATVLAPLPANTALKASLLQTIIDEQRAAGQVPDQSATSELPVADVRVDTIGSSAYSSAASLDGTGDFYAVTSNTTLVQIEMYLGITTSTTLRYFVYEGLTQAGTYSSILDLTVPSSGTGTRWYSSGTISVPLVAGRFYFIGVSRQGVSTYYYNGVINTLVSFGRHVSGKHIGYPPPATTLYGQFSLGFYQRLTTDSRAPVSYLVFMGTNPAAMSLIASNLSASSCAAGLLDSGTTYYWQVVASNAGGFTPGPVWQFTTRSLDHFAWDAIGSPQRAGVPFDVTLSAQDELGRTVTNFAGTAQLSGWSGDASVSDNFNRPDAPALGTNWTAQSGTWRIEANQARSSQSAGTDVVLFRVPASNAVVSADVFYQGSARTVYCALMPGYSNLANNVFVKVQDNFATGAFQRVFFYYGNNGGPWSGMTGGSYYVDVAPFTSARITTRLSGSQVTLEIDRNFDSVPEDTITRGGIPLAALGRGAALGGYFNATFDNFSLGGGGLESIPIRPLATGPFSDGWWRGAVTVVVPTANMYLRAVDGAANPGISNPFNVLPAPPIITLHPTNQVVVLGSNVTFWACAVGTEPLDCRWQRNGAPITGVTAWSHTITGVPFSENGARFSCVFSNAYGMVTSAVAVLTVDRPPVADASATRPMVISYNGTNATVVLDGSRSSDPDGDPLSYRWFRTGATNAFASGVVAVVTLPLGTNRLELVVSDGWAASAASFFVEVLTTAQATERLADAVTDGVDRNRPLIAKLQAALAAIDRSNPTAAMNQLQAFQHQVRSQIAPMDPALAEQFIRLAQDIIEILSLDSKARGKVAALGLQANGALRFQFSAPPGPIYIVEASADLATWDKIGVATDTGNGVFVFEDAGAPRVSTRFYRIVSP